MNLWDQILRLNFCGAPRFAWDDLGDYLPLFEPMLIPTGKIPSHVSCGKCGCNHRVFPGDGEDDFYAVCQCQESCCDDTLLKRAGVELFAIEERKLPNLLGDCFPMTPRLFSPFILGIQAWRLGHVHLRPDMREASLVVCFSGKDFDLNNTALGCRLADFGPTILVCRTNRPEELEAALRPESKVVDFEDMWDCRDGKFVAGKAARRLLAGWDDEAGMHPSETNQQKGHFFERRGQKRTKLNNEPYNLVTWRCWMEGRSFDLPDVVGSELLVRILLRRGDTIFADALLRSLSGGPAAEIKETDIDWMGTQEAQTGSKRYSPDARDEVLSSEEITRQESKIRNLQTEIIDCGDDPTLASEKEDLIEQRDELVAYLDKNTRPGPSGKRLPVAFDDTLTNAGNLVGKHIRRVIRDIKDINAGLWTHLSSRDILKYGQVCQYSTETGYKWLKK